jgi:hypothetical protein
MIKHENTLQFNPDIISNERINQPYFITYAKLATEAQESNSETWDNQEWINELMHKFLLMGSHSEIGNLLLSLPFSSIKLINTESFNDITVFFKTRPGILCDLIHSLGIQHNTFTTEDDATKSNGYDSNMMFIHSLGYLQIWQKIADDNINNSKFQHLKVESKNIKQFSLLKFN